MGIFGDLDVSDIPDNPFYIAPNTYWCVCTGADRYERDGQESLVIKWAIDEPDSEYHGNNISRWFSMPDLEGRSWADLDSDEKKALKFLKFMLRRGFDLSEEEIDSVSNDDLVGKEMYVTTVVTPDKENPEKEYVNVRDVVCKRLFDEQRGNTERVSATLGL